MNTNSSPKYNMFSFSGQEFACEASPAQKRFDAQTRSLSNSQLSEEYNSVTETLATEMLEQDEAQDRGEDVCSHLVKAETVAHLKAIESEMLSRNLIRERLLIPVPTNTTIFTSTSPEDKKKSIYVAPLQPEKQQTQPNVSKPAADNPHPTIVQQKTTETAQTAPKNTTYSKTGDKIIDRIVTTGTQNKSTTNTEYSSSKRKTYPDYGARDTEQASQKKQATSQAESNQEDVKENRRDYSSADSEYSYAYKKAKNVKPSKAKKNKQKGCLSQIGTYAILFVALIFLIKGCSSETTSSSPVKVTASISLPSISIEVPEAKISPLNPESGTIIYNRYADLSVNLTIKNDYHKDICLITHGSGVDAQMIFMRANSTATITAPMGTYSVYIATGNLWKDEIDFFGVDTIYYKANDNVTYPYSTDQTITIPADLDGFVKIDGLEG